MKNKRKPCFIVIFIALMILSCIWLMIRASSTISCTPYIDSASQPLYSERDEVMKAISLSYLTYGCETCDLQSGTVNEILEQNDIGIIIENFGIKRKNQADPSSATFDTAEFISRNVGDFRFLTSYSDISSSFYGAAFCDDINKCVWISYSGSVSLKDAFASIQLVIGPGLSAQEKSAFKLYEAVMDSREVNELSYSVLLTGHSLGGSLASMVSRMSGCSAITINGADGVAIDKINSIAGNTPTEYKITNYMTSIDGGKLSFGNLVQRLIFLGSYKSVDYRIFEENGITEDAHCAFSFVVFPNDDYSNSDIPEPIEKRTIN